MGGEDGLGVTTGQPNLYKQDLSKLDVSKLTALSREVISRQATINIGTIGHVAHGKSTIVKAISGVQTVRFKNELERNITIKLDAADCGSSGESAVIPGSVDSKTPAVSQKRHLSPTGGFDAPSCAKKPKFLSTEGRMSHRLDSRNSLCSSSSSSSSLMSLLSSSSSSLSSLSSASSMCLRPRQSITQQMLKAFDSSSRTRDESTSARDRGSDGRRSDYESSSSDGSRLSAREDTMTLRSDFELKEVRVLLHDIMRSDKYRELVAAAASPGKPSPVSSKKKKLWEVERILQKREQNGEPVYFIKWKDWEADYNTWEPLRNLVSCEALLREFEDERQKLIVRFKATTNFHPDICDVQLFLDHTYRNRSVVDAASAAATALAENTVYDEIRRFLKNSSHNTKLEAKIKRQLLRMLLIKLRRDQLESLQDWENEMNNITKGKPTIQVENLVDLESAPHDFYYIDNYLPGAGVIIPDDPPIGCECAGGCGTPGNKSGCCFAQNGATSLPYTSARRVRVPPGTPIYECNNRCACDASTCSNRVVQLGTSTQLCIFRTNNGRGWGVRTRRTIKKGTFVIQYVGEVINSEEAEKRGRQYNLTGRTYLFDLDYNETDDQCPYTVDAAMYGNVSHFVNHSCDPNLAVYAIWINCLEPNLPSLALFAIKDIKQNEELTFDYMCQTPHDNAKRQQLLEEEPEGKSPVSKNRMLCKCGAATCRQYLF